MSFDLIAVVFLFFLGLAVGSHVNVIVLRHGYREIANSRSECATCNVTPTWIDLIPVLSYIALKGRCRTCGSGISMQYPVVELLVGALFALSYYVYTPALTFLGLGQFVLLLGFWASLVAIVAYDVRHTLIPISFMVALAAFGSAFRIIEALSISSVIPLIDGILGAGLISLFFFVIHVVTRGRGMGIGDAYVAFGLGLFLGVIDGVSAVTLGVWAATLFYVLLYILSNVKVLRRFRVTMKTELPFAPWLALGTVVALFTELSPFSLGEWMMQLLWDAY